MNGQAAVRKSWVMFLPGEAALFILCAGIAAVFPQSIFFSSGVFVILSTIWAVYYYRLEYSITAGALKISSGIVFRKHILLPPENILWEMRLYLPPFRSSAAVVLHTSAGRAVIFGEYSTGS